MVQRPLFEKYGGSSSINKVILSLYDQLLKSEDVGELFDEMKVVLSQTLKDHGFEDVDAGLVSMPWNPVAT